MDDSLVALTTVTATVVHDATGCHGKAKLAESCNADGTSALYLSSARHHLVVPIHDDAAISLSASVIPLA